MSLSKISASGLSTTANITASQILSVSNTAIVGNITSSQITSISNTQIIGTTLPGPGQVTNIMLDTGSSSGNGALYVPSGNTAQRPANPKVGYIRYNTDLELTENYTANGWFKIGLTFPSISNISGTIYQGNTSTLTITGANFGANRNGYVNFVSGSISANVSIVPSTDTNITVLVPSAIYNLNAGNTVNISVTNGDGGISGYYSPQTIIGLPTGGTITQSSSYRIHTFTTSNTFIIPTNFTSSANVLVVAGGGGGGWDVGGGGGGGQSNIGGNGGSGIVIIRYQLS